MIRDLNPLFQALLGSLFTWGLTALGASLVGFISASNKKLLDVSLGFAAGVMTAASFWSLLAPAIEITELQYKAWAFFPVCLGFLAGAAFVYFADQLLPLLGFSDTNVLSMFHQNVLKEEEEGDSPAKIELSKNNNNLLNGGDTLRRRAVIDRNSNHLSSVDSQRNQVFIA